MNKFYEKMANNYYSAFERQLNMLTVLFAVYVAIELLENFIPVKPIYIELLLKKNIAFYFIFGLVFHFICRIKYAFEHNEDNQSTVEENRPLSISDIGLLNALTIGWISRILFSFTIEATLYNNFGIILLLPYVIYSAIAGSYTILLTIYLLISKNINDTKDTKNFMLSLIAVLITILALFR